MNFQIQNTEFKDLPAIVELALKTPELQDHEEPSFLQESVLKGYIESPHDIFLSVFEGEELIGFVICPFNPYTKVAYLEDIVLKQGHRGKGLGSQLIDHLKSILESKNYLDIWGLVHEDNQGMMQLLEKRGLKKGRKFYLYDGEL